MEKLPNDVLAALHDWYCTNNGVSGVSEQWTRYVLDYLREYHNQFDSTRKVEITYLRVPQFWHAKVSWFGYSREMNFLTESQARFWAERAERPSLQSEENRAQHCAQYGAD